MDTMNICKRSGIKGFTLVELLVVIAIVTILLSIVMASISSARENTREKRRVSDLANIELALTLFNEKNRQYPSFPSGVEIGFGGGLDATITPQFIANLNKDPLNSGSAGGAYAYWYDSDFICTEANQHVIFARTMEQSKNSNFNTVCTSPYADGNNITGTTYIRVLKQ